MTYQEAEAYINSIPRFAKEKSADNVKRILAHFDHPEQSFAYLHVAGTNGKGSVCAYMDSMLRTAGYRTGLFTSPHLIRMTERIRVDGEEIGEEDFAALHEELLAVVREGQEKGFPHPTFFEWIYLMAMIWFGRQQVAFGVIETGLGGRLDATNLAAHPALTVITSISYDHMEYLGDTLEEIAGEKAGIIKAGVPVFADGSCDEAVSVIRAVAEKKGASCEIVSPEQIKKVLNQGKVIDFCLEDSYHKTYDIHLETGAVYQMMNASLAFLALHYLAETDDRLKDMSVDLMKKGLADMRWAARLEELMPGIYVDGAHNVGGIRGLVSSLIAMDLKQPLYLVFAVASDKDYDEMIRLLCTIPGLAGVIVTEIESARRTDLHQVEKIFKQYFDGYTAHCALPAEAVRLGRDLAAGGTLVCAGSLYLAGSVKRALEGDQDDRF